MEKYNLQKMMLECMQTAADIYSDESDDEVILGLLDLLEKTNASGKIKRKRPWVKPWRKNRSAQSSFQFLTKELLPSDTPSFYNYVRMDDSQFRFLLDLIRDDIKCSNTQMRDAVPPSEKLAMTLRFLATGESFVSLNYQTKLSTSFISQTVPLVCEAIYNKLRHSFLKMPSNAMEWEIVAKQFALKWQFSNCLGALDGKHINFRPPRKSGAFYHNYKGTNSIILMALVDADCRFIYVDVGCNGRANDAGVFLETPLKKVLVEERNIPKNATVGRRNNLPYVIVADDAFPLLKHVMKPYPYHTTNHEKQIFNIRLSRARHVVEHAFGILSNRFRLFLSTLNVKVETVEKIVLACVTLHNYLMDTDNTYIFSCPAVPLQDKNGSNESPYNPRKGEAENIRQQFTKYFNEEGKLDWQNYKT